VTFRNKFDFYGEGVVIPTLNPKVGGPPIVVCPRLLIQYIRSLPPRMWEKRNVYRLLVGKPEGKRPLGRPRRRWMDNIMVDLLEIGLNDVDWIGLAQDTYSWRALVNSVMKFRIP
jgi:hypothetical protein